MPWRFFLSITKNISEVLARHYLKYSKIKGVAIKMSCPWPHSKNFKPCNFIVISLYYSKQTSLIQTVFSSSSTPYFKFQLLQYPMIKVNVKFYFSDNMFNLEFLQYPMVLVDYSAVKWLWKPLIQSDFFVTEGQETFLLHQVSYHGPSRDWNESLSIRKKKKKNYIFLL